LSPVMQKQNLMKREAEKQWRWSSDMLMWHQTI
jgi:hypothetical protein